MPHPRFLRLTQITLVFLYLVIIAGSVVRATGSGMGCPDWPKCFGHWIPPTDVSQLPANYRDFFKVQNEHIAPFNALQTWTEYGNRLVGAVLGVLMLIQLVFAWRYRNTDSRFLWLTLFSLILTGMEGVLGAIVVYRNLQTGVITMHMFLSLVILAVQTLLIFKASGKDTVLPLNPLLRKVALITLLFTVCQILLGTQVRETVDILLKNFDEGSRKDILANAGSKFTIHALFAWAVLLLNLAFLYVIRKDKVFLAVSKVPATLLLLVLLLEISAGEILNLCALPAYMQPVHLLLACMLFGIQWNLLIRTTGKTGSLPQ